MNQNINITTAKTRWSNEWTVRTIEWSALVTKLSKRHPTGETCAQYAEMSKEEKGRCKDVGGFVGGTLGDNGAAATGPRKAERVISRDLVTLDIDYAQDGVIDLIDDMLFGTEWALYSTHSHTPEKPRYRLIIPLDRSVTPEEYAAISRRIAEDIDIEQFDDTTYQAERLMYWPSCSSDGEYVFEHSEGDALNADKVLATYADYTNPAEWPKSTRVAAIVGPSAKHQEDPTEKKGIIGAFCRAYTISEAISAFLSDLYEPTDIEGRYTYMKGSTAGGVLVFDDKFIYSYHATDPISLTECNAFDLVRIHKFGDLDGEKDEYKPVNRKASFLAMQKFAQEDKRVIKLIKDESLAELEADFGQVVVAKDAKEVAPNANKLTQNANTEAEDDAEPWLHKCMDDKGRFISNPYVFQLICENDPNIAGLTKHDIFADQQVLQRDTPWAKVTEDHKYWTDIDDNGLVCYVAEHYKGLTGKQAIIDAHDLVMNQTNYHPVREYFEPLIWDKKPRLETLIIDFLGAEDDELTRAFTRKHFTAAVARIYHPGTKYDQILAFSGKEGAGKSTLIRKMAKEKWVNDSFSPSDIGDKSAMEQVRGCFLIEMAEMIAYKKSTSEAFKAFISKTQDEYRPAYGRKKIIVPRQCVFFTTTNEQEFLKGDTGNRRFWVIRINPDHAKYDIFTELTDDYVDQVWAEAIYYYKKGEKLYLDDKNLIELAIARQDAFNEIEADDRAGVIEAFIRKEIPSNWYDLTANHRSEYFKYGTAPGTDFTGMMKRKYICATEIANELFHKDMSRYEKREINQMLHRMKGLEYVGPYNLADREYGCQKRYLIRDEFYAKDKNAEDDLPE